MEPFIILDYTSNLMKPSHLKNVPNQSKGKALKPKLPRLNILWIDYSFSLHFYIKYF